MTMQEQMMIPATKFCTHYQIEVSFLHSLVEYGFVEVEHRDQEYFIPAHQIGELEKFLRLHSELNINLEGLDAINHLLERMQKMQHELATLKNRLRFYENIDE
jgi:chaperone modulatory protein CbpM